MTDDPFTRLFLPVEAASVRIARQKMTEELAARGLRDTFVADAELVMAELGANGVEHGLPRADGLVEMSWCILEESIRISVCDGGTVDTLRPVELSDVALRGRGLVIVDQLSDAWTVEHDEGTRVTAELRYAGSTKRAPAAT